MCIRAALRHTSSPTKDCSSPVEEASGNSSFLISESARTLSGLSAHDERLLRQRGAHCSLAPMHSAGRIIERFYSGTAGSWIVSLERQECCGDPSTLTLSPQPSANELLSQPWATGSHHVAAVARHLPGSGAATMSNRRTSTAGIHLIHAVGA